MRTITSQKTQEQHNTARSVILNYCAHQTSINKQPSKPLEFQLYSSQTKLQVQCKDPKSEEKTHMKAMETCLTSFSKFFIFASDCAQKMIAIHEHALYCNHIPTKFYMYLTQTKPNRSTPSLTSQRRNHPIANRSTTNSPRSNPALGN
jgi:hypothetical protein